MLYYASFCNFYWPGTLLVKSWDIFEIPSTPNFWHKHRHCCRSPLVPIFCTMRLFATFIGMEHSWESNGTFLGNSFQHIFWHEHRHCSWWPLVPIWCNMLQFATFIDRRGLEYCWDIFRKVFPPQFLARALALQSVAFRRSTARPKSVCFFARISFWTKFVYQSFFY